MKINKRENMLNKIDLTYFLFFVQKKLKMQFNYKNIFVLSKSINKETYY